MGLQQTLKALADPIRREILNMLKKDECQRVKLPSIFRNSPIYFKTFIGTERC